LAVFTTDTAGAKLPETLPRSTVTLCHAAPAR
jgi:hypothetical protein